MTPINRFYGRNEDGCMHWRQCRGKKSTCSYFILGKVNFSILFIILSMYTNRRINNIEAVLKILLHKNCETLAALDIFLLAQYGMLHPS